MYTLLITENNELITSVQERIMQRSKLVDKLHFLTAPMYKDHDMREFSLMMEYVMPISKRYKSEILTLSSKLYKDHLEYIIPIDTELTSEPGTVQIQLTFSRVEMNPQGKTTQYVRKISPGSIHIVPISAWSDFIPDDVLSELDQRMLQLLAREQHLEDLQNTYLKEKADDLSYENNVLQLLANGKKIGSGKTITNGTGQFDVVEFGNQPTNSESSTSVVDKPEIITF